jgi:hypothetical protein
MTTQDRVNIKPAHIEDKGYKKLWASLEETNDRAEDSCCEVNTETAS